MADLSIEFCGVKFPNPFTLAAAPPTDNAEMVARAFEAGWGGAILKTTSVETEVVELVYPMMAGIDYEDKKLMGLENIDLISERHIDEVEQDVRALKKEYPDRVVGASIMGAKKEDWQELVRRLEAAGVDLIECSFSCPHGMPERGMGSTIGQDPELTERTARWVKEAARRVPVIIKLTPQIADITEAARAVKRAGADGVCAINTLKSLIGIDLDTFIPYPNVGGYSAFGGYSGPAIKPVALRCVAEIAKAVDIPIAAAGGISTWSDAAEFLLVGATNIQLCTAVMRHGFRIIEDLIDGLDVFLEEKGMNSVRELVGKSLPYIVEHSRLSRLHKVVATIDHKTCVKDDICYVACRDGGHQAIELGEDRLPVVDEKKCKGCGMCATVCPVYGRIRLEPKVGAV
ncbi:MAG: NAD-dependent dihydropyrimidine dehydrogenase subunit PreA [Firmicutes bacterium]|jgi:dihydropyrimidine dehydrogenase (NAD+) subunit PreA|nr:NAD-dependent dihydropyrimidine dehydrogenase subunit PreA [Bacillota bacterium]MDH7496039.1 NAD-dependent dihydropyrimidine dehydrogenase subunit PreA [Bacillota bacterium]